MRRGLLVELGCFALAGLCFALTIDWSVDPVAGFDPALREAGALRVMTWNVGRPGGRRGAPLDDGQLEQVARTLRLARPDLCFLQEVAGSAQAAELAKRVGPDWDFVVSRRGSRRVAALFPEGESTVLDLPGLPERSLALGFVVPGRSAVEVLALHADAWSSERRNADIGGLSEALAARQGGPPKLLLGDLNLDVDHPGELFSDDAHLDLETYNFVAERWIDAGRGSGPTAEPDRRLDYVFVEPGRFEVLQVGAWLGRRAGEMDHDPLLIDLRPR